MATLSYRLILASGSPARRDLLRRAGFTFEIQPSNIDEPTEGFGDPRSMVEHIAWQKAAAIATAMVAGQPTVVLTADTIGWSNGQVIGKPADATDARRILQLLGGTVHELWSGVCLWILPSQIQIAWQERSDVAMTAMSDADLEAYIATGIWEGCSGAYAIQEEGDDPLVQVRTGTKSNVIGLPMETLVPILQALDANRRSFFGT